MHQSSLQHVCHYHCVYVSAIFEVLPRNLARLDETELPVDMDRSIIGSEDCKRQDSESHFLGDVHLGSHDLGSYAHVAVTLLDHYADFSNVTLVARSRLTSEDATIFPPSSATKKEVSLFSNRTGRRALSGRVIRIQVTLLMHPSTGVLRREEEKGAGDTVKCDVIPLQRESPKCQNLICNCQEYALPRLLQT